MRMQFILKFMCTDKNNDKNKTKPSPPPLPVLTVYFY